ncbi:MAG: DUF2330 domain-containing protein [Myxococcales bacterium]|nr:DUF2330 domain-containing protein [Myxococcales bacterium]
MRSSSSSTHKGLFIAGIAALTIALPARPADAFCGFYVGGAGADMFADATQVVMMRQGTTTVLTMQNRYDGPLSSFAMIVPIPEVLQKEQVKTLEPEIFKKVDTLTSPRLVEYWEQDPCRPPIEDDARNFAPSAPGSTQNSGGGVTVEAKFAVGEYEIVVLSTNESTALENWLKANNYAIPAGASSYLAPYVQGGSYFFAAKVDVKKVKFVDGRAVLSPLRFHYDSKDFKLPVRLGMINSQGKQDLIVYLLGENQRYELQNYPNITIPTNIEVANEVRDDFGAFYRKLFAETVRQNPKAAVTEYSWASSSCDPCPGPVRLTASDVATLGADVIEQQSGTQPGSSWRNWVITRIHMRYSKDEVGEDLVFRKAPPIVGGREIKVNGKLEKGSSPSQSNNFQARYIIRHRWTGTIGCFTPQYGTWGGDPKNAGSGPSVSSALSPNSTGASVGNDPAAGPALENLVREEVTELKIKPLLSSGGCSIGGNDALIIPTLALVVGLVVFGSVRRRRRQRR